MCWLRPHRQRARVRAQARARILYARYGNAAYWLARDRARAARGADRGRDQFWSQVAVEVARLEGRVIGLRTSERWR